MKNTLSRTLILSLVATSGFLAGCASVAVSEDAITKNTAFALSLDKSDFTISNREDSGLKTTYTVTTKAGKKYSCYVTGTVGLTGREVSDAMCNEMAKGGQSASAPAPKSAPAAAPASCNALLKAAGRC